MPGCLFLAFLLINSKRCCYTYSIYCIYHRKFYLTLTPKTNWGCLENVSLGKLSYRCNVKENKICPHPWAALIIQFQATGTLAFILTHNTKKCSCLFFLEVVDAQTLFSYSYILMFRTTVKWRLNQPLFVFLYFPVAHLLSCRGKHYLCSGLQATFIEAPNLIWGDKESHSRAAGCY